MIVRNSSVLGKKKKQVDVSMDVQSEEEVVNTVGSEDYIPDSDGSFNGHLKPTNAESS